MKDLLYKLIKPSAKTKLCIADILILIEPLTMYSQYYLIGNICVGLLIVILVSGYLCNKERLTKEERLTTIATIVVIILLLLFVLIRGY